MLRSEWRALRNTVRTKEGLQALAGTLIVFACLVLVGLAVGSMLMESDLLERVGAPDGSMLSVVVVALLLLPALLVLAFAKVPCRNQLFAGSHVTTWLASPVGSRRIVTMIWVRQVAGAYLASLAIAGVPMVAVVVRADLPIVTALAFLVVLLLVVGAAVALVLLVMVVATRVGSGGRWRQVLLLLHFAFVLALVVLLLSGVGRGAQLRSWLANVQLDGAWIFQVLVSVARLPVELAFGVWSPQSLVAPMVLLGFVVVALGGAARLYRTAFEALLCATPSGRVTQSSGAWPRTAVASLVHRGFVEAWRARGSLVLVSILGAVAVWRPAANPFVPLLDDSIPVLREVFFLQDSWLPLASVLAMLLFLGVIGDEQKQLSLLATSPLSRGDLLRSRVVLVGWPFLLTVVMAALSGKLVGGVGWLATIGFVLTASPCVLILLGASLAVGSWPAFVPVHSEVPLASNVRSVVPVLVLSAVAFGLFYAQHLARKNLFGHGDGPHGSAGVVALVLLAAWGVAVIVLVATYRLAHRNLTTLLGPQ